MTYVFDHIYKTGGTTFIFSYLHSFSQLGLLSARDQVVVLAPSSDPNRDLPELPARFGEASDGLQIVAGHFTGFLRARYPGAKYLTLVRDPIDRAISGYLHAKHHPDAWDMIGKRITEEKTTLAQFVQLDHPLSRYRNEQAAALLGEGAANREVTRTEIRSLIQSRFHLAGYTERLEQFLFCLHVEEGFPLILFNNRLVRPERDTFTPSPEDLEVVRRCNALDEVVYAHVREEFDARFARILSPSTDRLYRSYLSALAQFRSETAGQVNACAAFPPATPRPRPWAHGAEIAGVFAMREAVACNSARITGSDVLSVRTDDQQWSYAVAFRASTECLRRLNPGEALLVRVDVSVQSGSVGILFATEDLAAALATGEEILSGSGELAELLVEPPPESGWLVIRNHAAGGVSSACTVRSIRTFAAKRSAAPAARAELDAGVLESLVLGRRDEELFLRLHAHSARLPVTDAKGRDAMALLALSDAELERLWMDQSRHFETGETFGQHKLCHALYGNALRGKRVLEIGPGLGIDGITLARRGARVTFIDDDAGKLEVLRRLCRILAVNECTFVHTDSIRAFDELPGDFDVVWCRSWMAQKPFHLARRLSQALVRRLATGGRWMELAYSREAWERCGRPAFCDWAAGAGETAPWVEWYDAQRLLQRLHPVEFRTVVHWQSPGEDLNWFDMVRIG